MAKSYPGVSTVYLEKLYDIDKMSLPQISELTGMTAQSVWDRFKKIGKILRPRGEAVHNSYVTGRSHSQKGENNHNWKRGYYIDRSGYVQRIVCRKQIPEHRLIWEKYHGAIPQGWVIHHLNGIKTDNRIENLAAMPRKQHSPKKILEPYKIRIRQLEACIASMGTGSVNPRKVG